MKDLLFYPKSIIAIFVCFLFMQCEKQASKITTKTEVYATIPPVSRISKAEVKQKHFDGLKQDQVVALVENFKASKNVHSENNDQSERLIEADSLALDSAVFLLEAVLNYDFDYELEMVYPSSRTDSLIFSIPLDGAKNTISSDDLELAYEAFSNSLLDSSGSVFKIKCIDLTAEIDNPSSGSVDFLISVTKYAYNYYPASCPTNPFSSTSTYKAMDNTSWNVYLSATCGANNLPPAPTALNVYKNCSGISHKCPPTASSYGFYYDVWTTAPLDIWVGPGDCSSNTIPNVLWCYGYFPSTGAGSSWCTITNTSLSGSQLNSFLANQIAWANTSSLPWEPIVRQVNCNVILTSLWDSTCNCYAPHMQMSWPLVITYGKFSCVRFR